MHIATTVPISCSTSRRAFDQHAVLERCILQELQSMESAKLRRAGFCEIVRALKKEHSAFQNQQMDSNNSNSDADASTYHEARERRLMHARRLRGHLVKSLNTLRVQITSRFWQNAIEFMDTTLRDPPCKAKIKFEVAVSYLAERQCYYFHQAQESAEHSVGRHYRVSLADLVEMTIASTIARLETALYLPEFTHYILNGNFLNNNSSNSSSDSVGERSQEAHESIDDSQQHGVSTSNDSQSVENSSHIHESFSEESYPMEDMHSSSSSNSLHTMEYRRETARTRSRVSVQSDAALSRHTSLTGRRSKVSNHRSQNRRGGNFHGVRYYHNDCYYFYDQLEDLPEELAEDSSRSTSSSVLNSTTNNVGDSANVSNIDNKNNNNNNNNTTSRRSRPATQRQAVVKSSPRHKVSKLSRWSAPAEQHLLRSHPHHLSVLRGSPPADWTAEESNFDDEQMDFEGEVQLQHRSEYYRSIHQSEQDCSYHCNRDSAIHQHPQHQRAVSKCNHAIKYAKALSNHRSQHTPIRHVAQQSYDQHHHRRHRNHYQQPQQLLQHGHRLQQQQHGFEMENALFQFSTHQEIDNHESFIDFDEHEHEHEHDQQLETRAVNRAETAQMDFEAAHRQRCLTPMSNLSLGTSVSPLLISLSPSFALGNCNQHDMQSSHEHVGDINNVVSFNNNTNKNDDGIKISNNKNEVETARDHKDVETTDYSAFFSSSPALHSHHSKLKNFNESSNFRKNKAVLSAEQLDIDPSVFDDADL